jgi:hypothetical protein
LGFANGQKIVDGPILHEVLMDLDMEMLGSGTANKVGRVTNPSSPPMTLRFGTTSKAC